MDTIVLIGKPEARDITKIFSVNKPPLEVFRTISPSQFEDLTYGWVIEYLQPKEKYVDAVQLGSGKDGGRDIIAYFAEDKKEFDIFQCKRYDKTLSPSMYFCEFGKLCYYTKIGEYAVPRNYFLVANREIGKELRYFFENPNKIADKLIEKWDEWCAKKISNQAISLTGELREYISKFNFNIVKDISPGKFLEQVKTTRYYKYYFGGGIEKRTPIEDIDLTKKIKLNFPFVVQLFKIYTQELHKEILSQDDLIGNNKEFNHFTRQYNAYFYYLSLVRFARDQLIDSDDSVKTFLDQIYYAIADSYDKAEFNTLQRVYDSTQAAINASINSQELGAIDVRDKIGACHELVNKGKIRWYDE